MNHTSNRQDDAMWLLGIPPGNKGVKGNGSEKLPNGIIDAIPFGKWLQYCFAVSLAVLLIGIAGIDTFLSFLIVPSAIVFCASAMAYVYRFLFEEWASDYESIFRQTFLSCDRRGNRIPIAIFRHQIQKCSENLLRTQPIAGLLALVASGKMDLSFDNAVTRISGLASSNSLAAHPAVTTLTRIDFALSDDDTIRKAAVVHIPRRLWARAIALLFASKFPEANEVAIRSETIPRRMVIKACARNADASVREAAWLRIGGTLTDFESYTLSRSANEDVRLHAVQSPSMNRERLIQLCACDETEAIRTAVWHRIRTDLSETEADTLCQSNYAEVRTNSIRTGLLTRSRIVELCAADPDEGIRKTTWEQLRTALTKKDAIILSRSAYEEIRSLAVRSGRLGRARLVRMCRRDGAQSVRHEAWERIEKGLRFREATALSRSRHSDMRLLSVQSGLLHPARMDRLYKKDVNSSVRIAAGNAIKAGFTSDRLVQNSRSEYSDVRQIVAAHPSTPRYVLYRLARDGDRNVRDRALQRILEDLTPEELRDFSRSEYDDVRTAVAGHPATPDDVLLRYVNDTVDAVRSRALARVLDKASVQQIQPLLRSHYADVRLAVGAHHGIQRNDLFTLVDDRDQLVREQTLQILLNGVTAEELQKLSLSHSTVAREAVAAHPASPRDVLLTLSKDDSESVRQRALPRVLDAATADELKDLVRISHEDVRLTVANWKNTPRNILLELKNDRSRAVLERVLSRILDGAQEKELEELSKSNVPSMRLAAADHVETPRDMRKLLAADTDETVRRTATQRLLRDATAEEVKNLLDSTFDDVKRMSLQQLGNRGDRKNVEVILPHLRAESTRRDAADAILRIEGVPGLRLMFNDIGSNATIRLVSEEQLASYFDHLESGDILAHLSGITVESKTITIGSRSYETSDYSDPYGGYSNTYTTNEDVYRTVSYFRADLVSKALRILDALTAEKKNAVIDEIIRRESGIFPLLAMGVKKLDWRNAIAEPILRAVHATNEVDFTAASDESIIGQIIEK